MRNLIHPPVSRVQKPVFFAKYLKLIHRTVRAIPSGVHPEVLKADFFFGDLLDKFQTRGCLHPTPPQSEHGKNDWFPVILGLVVFQDMPPQDIMCVDIVSFPWKQKDLRGANLLAGMQREVCRLHAGTESNRCLGGTREVDGPLSWPSQSTDQASPLRPYIEERDGLNGFTAAFTGDLKRLKLIQSFLHQGISIHDTASLGVKNGRNALASDWERNVERLNILDDRSVGLALIPEIRRPLHYGRVRKLHRLQTNLQTGFRIGPKHGMFRAAAIDLLDFRLPRPDFQQRSGSLPVISKREWQLSLVIQQVFFQPSVVLAHIGGLIPASCLDVIRHENEYENS